MSKVSGGPHKDHFYKLPQAIQREYLSKYEDDVSDEIRLFRAVVLVNKRISSVTRTSVKAFLQYMKKYPDRFNESFDGGGGGAYI